MMRWGVEMTYYPNGYEEEMKIEIDTLRAQLAEAIRQRDQLSLDIRRGDEQAISSLIRQAETHRESQALAVRRARAKAIAEVKALLEQCSGSFVWHVIPQLDALAPAPPGSVLVSREDAEKALIEARFAGLSSASVATLGMAEARRLLGLPVKGQP